MKIYAVITGDIVGSSRLKEKEKEAALKALKSIFEDIQRNKEKSEASFKFFRGDSFQGIIFPAEHALRHALTIKTALKKLSKENNQKKVQSLKSLADIRIAVGIGKVDFLKEEITESDGEAFRYSGRALDEMKKEGQKMIVITPWPEKNEELETECALLDAITDKWSSASSEVVFYLLKGLKEQEIASVLNISQPSVNIRKRVAAWDAVNKLLNRFETTIKEKTT